MTPTVDGIEARLADLEAKYQELSSKAAMASDVDVIWLIVSAVLVFFMQVGFAMVRAPTILQPLLANPCS